MRAHLHYSFNGVVWRHARNDAADRACSEYSRREPDIPSLLARRNLPLAHAVAAAGWRHPYGLPGRLISFLPMFIDRSSGKDNPFICRCAATLAGRAEKVARLKDIPIAWGILCGLGIGLLSGLTGTGGGIFLSPLLLFRGWSDVRTASGVAAVFILCNSIAGLAGNIALVRTLPPELPIYAAAVLLGLFLGTTLGMRLGTPLILKALGAVLAIAGAKLIGVY